MNNPCLSATKVMVAVARTAGDALPVSGSRPDGRSMARTGTPATLMASMAAIICADNGARMPMPSSASTISSHPSSCACHRRRAARCQRSTRTASPACCARRATTWPSPPLLPPPQTTAMDFTAGQRARRQAKAAAPARSISAGPDVPAAISRPSSCRTWAAEYSCGGSIIAGEYTGADDSASLPQRPHAARGGAGIRRSWRHRHRTAARTKPS